MKNITLLTIILSWNRPELLERTIHSYLRTVSVPYKLIVVDNGSDQKTVSVLARLAAQYNFKAVFLKKNIGGKAFNEILNNEDLHPYQFIHFSENDIEYRQEWDKELIRKFNAFPNVGQISPYSPFPQEHNGEIWETKQAILVKNREFSLYMTKMNVGTTCIVRKNLIQQGLRWKNINQGRFHFPADGLFSADVRRLGWKVAWNDKYLATNWGHNIVELQKDLQYYMENYSSKKLGLAGFKKRLKKIGYKLVKRADGSYRIIAVNQRRKKK